MRVGAYIVEANVDVGAMALLGRYVRDDAFSVLPVVVDLEMVHGFQRVQQTYVLQVFVGREETFAQVLRTLEIFQDFDELLSVFGLDSKESETRS